MPIRCRRALEPVVQDLVNYINADIAVESAFERGFGRARNSGIDLFHEYNINTLTEFIEWYSQLLTWTPSETTDAKKIYNVFCLFYYVLDQSEIKIFQSAIEPGAIWPWKWLSQWLINYAICFGTFMDTPASITPETVQSFWDTGSLYHMEEYIVPPGGWKTFNEFFARNIKPELRPIAGPCDPTIVVSPADCHYDGSWEIDSNEVVFFKGVPWSINTLLRDSAYGERFRGGRFMHAFLNTTDYHRQHAPVAGKVIEAKVIPGLCYLQVEADPANPGKLGMKRKLDAPDDPGYQFLQARGLIVIESEIGLVAVLPIGMAQVSSVVVTVEPGQMLAKGDEISYFQLGGSDIVVVFEAQAQVQLPQNPKHGEEGPRMWVHSQMGRATVPAGFHW